MALKSFKPTSPGVRFMTRLDFGEVTKDRPELSTADALHVHVYQALAARQIVFSRRALVQLSEVLSS